MQIHLRPERFITAAEVIDANFPDIYISKAACPLHRKGSVLASWLTAILRIKEIEMVDSAHHNMLLARSKSYWSAQDAVEDDQSEEGE